MREPERMHDCWASAQRKHVETMELLDLLEGAEDCTPLVRKVWEDAYVAGYENCGAMVKKDADKAAHALMRRMLATQITRDVSKLGDLIDAMREHGGSTNLRVHTNDGESFDLHELTGELEVTCHRHEPIEVAEMNTAAPNEAGRAFADWWERQGLKGPIGAHRAAFAAGMKLGRQPSGGTVIEVEAEQAGAGQ